MILLIVSLVYTLGALVSARYLFASAVRGGFETDTASRMFLGVGFALLYSLAWPLLLVGVSALWFIARGPKRDAA